MNVNGIPISKNTARLLFLPISHLMKHTLLACPLDQIENEEFRDEYAKDIFPQGDRKWDATLWNWPLEMRIQEACRQGIFHLGMS